MTPLADLLAELRTHRWVDLTHAFAPGIPHYVAFPDEVRTPLFTHEGGDGFRADSYAHVGQWGTHMDPPCHFAPGGRTQDQVPVTDMLLPLAVLHLADLAAADPDLTVGPGHIEAYEAEYGRIPATAFVAADFGWDARWPDSAAMQNQDAAGVPHYPGWGVDALRLLVEEARDHGHRPRHHRHRPGGSGSPAGTHRRRRGSWPRTAGRSSCWRVSARSRQPGR